MNNNHQHALYALQRESKIGTNIYKIGMTESGLMNRINNEASYRLARIIITREVSDGSKAESMLKLYLSKHNILRCKDIDKNYKGIEDYVIDDLPKFIQIFNDVCNNFIIADEYEGVIEPFSKEPILELTNSIYGFDFMNIITKRKNLIQFLGKNNREIINNWTTNFNKIFKPIEIYKGVEHTYKNPFIGYQLNTKALYEHSGLRSQMTLTKFVNEMQKLVDICYEKYKGTIHYKTVDDDKVVKEKTRAKLLLIMPTNVKLFLNTNSIINKYREYSSDDFISSFDVNVMHMLKRYDKDDFESFIDNNINNLDEISKVIIDFLCSDHYNIRIDNINYIDVNNKSKIITIDKEHLQYFNNFKPLFKYNTTIDYELIKELKMFNAQTAEKFLLYHLHISEIFTAMLYEESKWNLDMDNKPLLYEFLEFMFDKIYRQNNISSVIMANKFKDKFIKNFESKYKNFLVLDPFTKESLYLKLDIYIKDNHKLRSQNDPHLSMRINWC